MCSARIVVLLAATVLGVCLGSESSTTTSHTAYDPGSVLDCGSPTCYDITGGSCARHTMRTIEECINDSPSTGESSRFKCDVKEDASRNCVDYSLFSDSHCHNAVHTNATIVCGEHVDFKLSCFTSGGIDFAQWGATHTAAFVPSGCVRVPSVPYWVQHNSMKHCEVAHRVVYPGINCSGVGKETVIRKNACEDFRVGDVARSTYLQCPTPVAHEHEEHLDHTKQEDVHALMFTVLVGTVVYFWREKVPIPFTVLMLLYGIIVGFISEGIEVVDTYAVIGHVDPHLLFTIFLPILIFEGSFNMRSDVLKKVFWQAVILATLGVVIPTACVAALLKGAFYDHWSWGIAILFGSIMSATDPVAVVAILKELGMDRRLTTLIDGEAIMNDGTAIVIFAIFLPTATGDSLLETGPLIGEAVRLSLVAIPFGALCGFAIFLTLNVVRSLVLVEVPVSIFGAFLAFTCAELWLGTSGVLTLAVMGMFLSAFMPSAFPGTKSVMRETWEIMVHIANVIVFAYLGMVIAREALPEATGEDVGALFTLYIALNVVRGVVVALFAPLFNRMKTGYHLTPKHGVILSLSGLRGVVGITLVLIIAENDRVDFDGVSSKMLFLVGGIVILTLLVNATGAKYLVRLLGLSERTASTSMQMHFAAGLVVSEMRAEINKLKANEFFILTCWDSVERYTIDKFRDPYNKRHGMVEVDDRNDVYRILDVVVMRALKVDLWKQKDEGNLTEAALRRMLSVVNEFIAGQKGLCTMMDLRAITDVRPWWVTFLNRNFHGARLAKYVVNRYNFVTFEVYLAYSRAIRHLIKEIPIIVASQHAVERYMKWMADEQEHVLQYLNELYDNQHKEATHILSRRAIRDTLLRGKELISRMRKTGGMSLADVEKYEEEITELLLHSESAVIDSKDDTEALFYRSTVISDLPPEDQKFLLAVTTTEMCTKGSLINLDDSVVIIRKGIVEVMDNGVVVHFGSGYVGGMIHCLTHSKKRWTSLTVLSPVVTYWRIDATRFHELVERSPQAAKVMWSLCGRKITMRLLGRMYPFTTWPYQKLRRHCERGVLVSFDEDASWSPDVGAECDVLVLAGLDETGSFDSRAGQFFIPIHRPIIWLKGTKLFVVYKSFASDVLAIEKTKNRAGHGDLEMRFQESDPSNPSAPVFDPHEQCSGISCLDVQHMRWVGVIESLRHAICDEKEELALPTTLQFLVRHCLVYFAVEEALMARHNYPRMEEHKRKHRHFCTKVHRWIELSFLFRLSAKTVYDELNSWLAMHLSEDRDLGNYLLEQGVPVKEYTSPQDVVDEASCLNSSLSEHAPHKPMLHRARDNDPFVTED